MVERNDILSYMAEYLQTDSFEDGCVNGMQLEGSAVVTKVVTGVSLNEALIDAAIGRGAEMIVVHHGLFYGKGPMVIGGVLARRLKKLLEHNITVVGMHLPLDYHAEVGNAVQLLEALGATTMEQQRGEWVGLWGSAQSQEDMMVHLRNALEGPVQAEWCGKQQIRKVMVVTGAGARFLPKAVAAGVDLFITGEPKEDMIDYAREVGMNFVAGGHYHTEVWGPRALAAVLQKQFGIPAVFVGIENWG